MPIDLLPSSKLQQAAEDNVDDLTPEQLASWKTAYPRLGVAAAAPSPGHAGAPRRRVSRRHRRGDGAAAAQLQRSMKEGRHEVKHLSGGRDVGPMVITISRLGDVEMVDADYDDVEAASPKSSLVPVGGAS